MQNVIGTCLVIGLLAGGFAVTGDLGRLAARGMRVVEATSVPDHDDDAPIAVPDESAGQASSPGIRGPARRRAAPGGPDCIDLAALPAGQRLVVWLDGAVDPLAIDVVDPVSAAVILHREPAQRAAIAGGRVVRGGELRVLPLGLAHAAGGTPAECVGRVAAIQMDR